MINIDVTVVTEHTKQMRKLNGLMAFAKVTIIYFRKNLPEIVYKLSGKKDIMTRNAWQSLAYSRSAP